VFQQQNQIRRKGKRPSRSRRPEFSSFSQHSTLEITSDSLSIDPENKSIISYHRVRPREKNNNLSSKRSPLKGSSKSQHNLAKGSEISQLSQNNNNSTGKEDREESISSQNNSHREDTAREDSEAATIVSTVNSKSNSAKKKGQNNVEESTNKALISGISDHGTVERQQPDNGTISPPSLHNSTGVPKKEGDDANSTGNKNNHHHALLDQTKNQMVEVYDQMVNSLRRSQALITTAASRTWNNQSRVAPTTTTAGNNNTKSDDINGIYSSTPTWDSCSCQTIESSVSSSDGRNTNRQFRSRKDDDFSYGSVNQSASLDQTSELANCTRSTLENLTPFLLSQKDGNAADNTAMVLPRIESEEEDGLPSDNNNRNGNKPANASQRQKNVSFGGVTVRNFFPKENASHVVGTQFKSDDISTWDSWSCSCNSTFDSASTSSVGRNMYNQYSSEEEEELVDCNRLTLRNMSFQQFYKTGIKLLAQSTRLLRTRLGYGSGESQFSRRFTPVLPKIESDDEEDVPSTNNNTRNGIKYTSASQRPKNVSFGTVTVRNFHPKEIASHVIGAQTESKLKVKKENRRNDSLMINGPPGLMIDGPPSMRKSPHVDMILKISSSSSSAASNSSNELKALTASLDQDKGADVVKSRTNLSSDSVPTTATSNSLASVQGERTNTFSTNSSTNSRNTSTTQDSNNDSSGKNKPATIKANSTTIKHVIEKKKNSEKVNSTSGKTVSERIGRAFWKKSET